jgi:hypothetical protein
LTATTSTDTRRGRRTSAPGDGDNEALSFPALDVTLTTEHQSLIRQPFRCSYDAFVSNIVAFRFHRRRFIGQRPHAIHYLEGRRGLQPPRDPRPARSEVPGLPRPTPVSESIMMRAESVGQPTTRTRSRRDSGIEGRVPRPCCRRNGLRHEVGAQSRSGRVGRSARKLTNALNQS